MDLELVDNLDTSIGFEANFDSLLNSMKTLSSNLKTLQESGEPKELSNAVTQITPSIPLKHDNASISRVNEDSSIETPRNIHGAFFRTPGLASIDPVLLSPNDSLSQYQKSFNNEFRSPSPVAMSTPMREDIDAVLLPTPGTIPSSHKFEGRNHCENPLKRIATRLFEGPDGEPRSSSHLRSSSVNRDGKKSALSDSNSEMTVDDLQLALMEQEIRHMRQIRELNRELSLARQNSQIVDESLRNVVADTEVLRLQEVIRELETKHKIMKEDRDSLRISLHSSAEIRSSSLVGTLKKEVEEERTNRILAESTIRKLQASLEDLQAESKEYKETISAMKKNFSISLEETGQYSIKIRRLEEERDDLQHQLGTRVQQLKEMISAVEKARARSAEAAAMRDSIAAALATAESQLTKQSAELKALRTSSEFMNDQLQDLNSFIVRLKDENEQLRGQLKVFNALAEGTESNSVSESAAVSPQTEEKKTESAEAAKALIHLKDMKTELDAMRRSNISLKEEVASLKAKQSTSTASFELERSRLQATIESLRSDLHSRRPAVGIPQLDLNVNSQQSSQFVSPREANLLYERSGALGSLSVIEGGSQAGDSVIDNYNYAMGVDGESLGGKDHSFSLGNSGSAFEVARALAGKDARIAALEGDLLKALQHLEHLKAIVETTIVQKEKVALSHSVSNDTFSSPAQLTHSSASSPGTYKLKGPGALAQRALQRAQGSQFTPTKSVSVGPPTSGKKLSFSHSPVASSTTSPGGLVDGFMHLQQEHSHSLQEAFDFASMLQQRYVLSGCVLPVQSPIGLHSATDSPTGTAEAPQNVTENAPIEPIRVLLAELGSHEAVFEKTRTFVRLVHKLLHLVISAVLVPSSMATSGNLASLQEVFFVPPGALDRSRLSESRRSGLLLSPSSTVVDEATRERELMRRLDAAKVELSARLAPVVAAIKERANEFNVSLQLPENITDSDVLSNIISDLTRMVRTVHQDVMNIQSKEMADQCAVQ